MTFFCSSSRRSSVLRVSSLIRRFSSHLMNSFSLNWRGARLRSSSSARTMSSSTLALRSFSRATRVRSRASRASRRARSSALSSRFPSLARSACFAARSCSARAFWRASSSWMIFRRSSPSRSAAARSFSASSSWNRRPISWEAPSVGAPSARACSRSPSSSLIRASRASRSRVASVSLCPARTVSSCRRSRWISSSRALTASSRARASRVRTYLITATDPFFTCSRSSSSWRRRARSSCTWRERSRASWRRRPGSKFSRRTFSRSSVSQRRTVSSRSWISWAWALAARAPRSGREGGGSPRDGGGAAGGGGGGGLPGEAAPAPPSGPFMSVSTPPSPDIHFFTRSVESDRAPRGNGTTRLREDWDGSDREARCWSHFSRSSSPPWARGAPWVRRTTVASPRPRARRRSTGALRTSETVWSPAS